MKEPVVGKSSSLYFSGRVDEFVRSLFAVNILYVFLSEWGRRMEGPSRYLPRKSPGAQATPDEFEPLKQTLSATTAIAATPAEIFPLLCPVREYEVEYVLVGGMAAVLHGA